VASSNGIVFIYDFIQVPFLFLTLPGAESLYFSFVFIGGLFVVPFALLEFYAWKSRQIG
jgi:hypothetical protein